MKKVAILGAGGQIARWVIEALAHNDDVQLTLFLRNAKRLKRPPKQSTVVQGDVLNQQQLREAVVGQDIVYANLTRDDIDEQAEQIVRVMRRLPSSASSSSRRSGSMTTFLVCERTFSERAGTTNKTWERCAFR